MQSLGPTAAKAEQRKQAFDGPPATVSLLALPENGLFASFDMYFPSDFLAACCEWPLLRTIWRSIEAMSLGRTSVALSAEGTSTRLSEQSAAEVAQTPPLFFRGMLTILFGR